MMIAGLFFHIEITGMRELRRRPAINHVPAYVHHTGERFTQAATHFIAGPMRLCIVWRNP
jgi:hypothetical protein